MEARENAFDGGGKKKKNERSIPFGGIRIIGDPVILRADRIVERGTARGNCRVC